MEETKPSNTDRLNDLLEVYKKNLEEHKAAQDLIETEIKKTKALIKDIEKVALKYVTEVKEEQKVDVQS